MKNSENCDDKEKNGISNEDVMMSLKAKMTSGNDIPCSGCRITKEEYLVIMNSLAGD